jgi:hypothetical protein
MRATILVLCLLFLSVIGAASAGELCPGAEVGEGSVLHLTSEGCYAATTVLHPKISLIPPPTSSPYATCDAVGRVYAVGAVVPTYPGSSFVQASVTMRVQRSWGYDFPVYTCFGPDAYTCQGFVTGTVVRMQGDLSTGNVVTLTSAGGGGLN